MNFYAISSLLATIICISLGIFVYFQGIKKVLNQTFSLVSILIGLWCLFPFLTYIAFTDEKALFYGRLAYIAAVFTPSAFFHFVFVMIGIDKRKVEKTIIKSFYLISVLFLTILFTPNFIKGIVRRAPHSAVIPGILYPVFILFFGILCPYAIYQIFVTTCNTTGYRKNQLKYLFLGFFIALGGGILHLAAAYIHKEFISHDLLLISWAIITTYAIIKHRLMDIKVAVTRAGIFILVYLFVLGIPFVLGYKYGQWQLATWVTVFLATSGPFIYLYLQHRAEKIIRKEQLQYQKDLRDISSTMMLIKELERLLRTIVLRVVDIVRVSWAGIYLKDEKELKYTLRHQRARTGEINLPKEFSFDSDLVKHLYRAKLPLIGEEIYSFELKVGLAVPCFIEDNLLGFLLLGDKPKGQIYDQSDVNTFTFLANQTALAIENCQFYSQERQREHFRRIASLDRQIDCMAHEMDNPIHATLGVLGSIELALDELKEIIPADKMDYLKQKLSRVEFHAGRVSKMISAVKEFTKPTTGELGVITLQQIIDSFVAILTPQIHHYGVNFTLNIPEEPLWLRANKVELEQVLVNLGTNSVQAIKEAPKENKKDIMLKAFPKDTSILRIDFTDTGSGIEEKLLEDIFLDFVTTKASSEGTGLGLSISRKIIQRHKGKIWAESEGKGKGAIFHIELPLATDITEEEKRKFSDAQNEDRKRDLI